MNTVWKKELENLLGENKLKEHEELSSHITSHIGGKALFYTEIDSIELLLQVLKLTRQLEIPVFLLGSGNAVIFRTQEFEGLVIKNLCRSYESVNVSGKIVKGRLLVDKAYLYAESGALLTQFVRFSLDKDYSGLEDFLGFPGTIGEALYMHITSEISHDAILTRVKSLTVLTTKGEIDEIEPEVYVKSDHKEFFLLAAIFTLYPADHETVWEKANAASQIHSSIQEEGTILGPLFQDISQADAIRIPTPSHTRRAAYLIDHSGIADKKIGEVRISSRNSNYLVHNGNASYDDISHLLDFIQKAVYDTFRVRLISRMRTV